MKAIRLFGVALFTVLLCVGFSSCSKSDDDNGASLSNPLVGTWRAEVHEHDVNHYWEITFNADFSWSTVDYRKDKEKPSNPDESGTYTIKDNTTLILTNSKGEVDSIKFTITDGNKLVFSEGERVTYYKIK
jgi:hypothetical protein